MHQTYLILIRDGKLALAVGAAIEDRLQADGHHAVAFVPSVRGSDTGSEDNLRQADLWGEIPPQVIALYEDGLLERLESLGLAAYVGVPADQDWRVIHWDDQSGAVLLPVVTARDLVDAIADRTPWHEHASGDPRVTRLRDRTGRRAGRGETSAASAALSRRLFPVPGVSRKLAAASVAGPMLLVGLPATAAAACTPAGHASARAGSGRADVHTFGTAGTQSGATTAVPMPVADLPWSSTAPRFRPPHHPRHAMPALPGAASAPPAARHVRPGLAQPAAPAPSTAAAQPSAPARSAAPAPVARRPAPGGGGGGGGGIPPVHPFTSSAPLNPSPHATPITVVNNPPAPRPPQLPRGSRSGGDQTPSEDPLDGAPFDPNDPGKVLTASNEQSPDDGAPASPDDAPQDTGPVMLASGADTATDASPGGVAGLGQEPADTAPAAAVPPAPTPAPPVEAPTDLGLSSPGAIDPGALDPAPIVPAAIQPVDAGGGVSIGISQIPGTGDSVLGANDGSSPDGGSSLSADSGLGSTGGVGDASGGDGGGD